MSEHEDIRARLAEITLGEWRAFNYAEFEDGSLPPEDSWWLEGPAFVDYDVYSLFHQGDAEFIAHAPEDMRALLDHINQQQQCITELQAALERIAHDAYPLPVEDNELLRETQATLAACRKIAGRALKGSGED